MMKSTLLGVAMLVLIACTDEQRYRAIGSPPIQMSPIRYPLDFPICRAIPGTDAGEIIVPLRLRIYGAGLPDPKRVMALRKKDPAADGCSVDMYKGRPPRPSITQKDSFNSGRYNYGGWMPLDKTGNGYFSASSYKNQLLNAKDLQAEKDQKKEVANYDAINLVRFGHVATDIIVLDENVVINGLTWRHQIVAQYDTKDPTHATHGELLGWNETYEYAIDDSHTLRRTGRYVAMILTDPHWIAARRNLLLQLVQAIHIEPMTKAEVDVAVAEDERQREQDEQEWKRKH